MNTKRTLLSAAALLSLTGCHKWEGPLDDPGIAAAKEQILATSACREDGATLNVPSEKYPTIAAALVAAKSGDTVRVAAGTYQECVVLVDGVTLSGPEVRAGQPPSATLDGTGTCRPVVFGDATILHGASIKGFRIINSGNFGIWLTGSNGVHVSGVSVEGSPSAGFRADQSSVVLEHSNFLGNGGAASVRITQGSRAVLVANDIVGVSNGAQVENGLFLNDPMWAPSQAWLINNVIHDNGVNGLLVRDKGSEVRGVGNRYEGNHWDSVMVTGGAVYVGQHETMTHADGTGVTARGCDLRCPNTFNCSDPVLVQEHTKAVVESTTIRDNSWRGIYALCGATVTIGRSTISGNVGGAEAATSWSLDPSHAASAPVVLDVSDSLFDGNTGANLVVWGKGAVGHGFKNRYEGKDDGTTLYGLHATGGGRYLGQRDSFKGNAHFGVFALGHEVVCATEDCSVLVVDREETLVTLDNATLSGNGYDGVLALCGTTVELRDSASTGNGGSGAVAMSTCDWGDLGLSAAPSRIFARGTLFSENREDGVTAYEDSQLLLGSLADPGRNSFLGNLARSIANSTPNPVLAQWNWFGTSDAAAIASSIVDCRADPSYGCVEYVPFLSRAPRGNGR